MNGKKHYVSNWENFIFSNSFLKWPFRPYCNQKGPFFNKKILKALRTEKTHTKASYTSTNLFIVIAQSWNKYIIKVQASWVFLSNFSYWTGGNKFPFVLLSTSLSFLRRGNLFVKRYTHWMTLNKQGVPRDLCTDMYLSTYLELGWLTLLIGNKKLKMILNIAKNIGLFYFGLHEIWDLSTKI